MIVVVLVWDSISSKWVIPKTDQTRCIVDFKKLKVTEGDACECSMSLKEAMKWTSLYYKVYVFLS